MIRESGVGTPNYGFCLYSWIKSHHGMHSFISAFCAFCGPGADNGAFNDTLLCIQFALDVIWKDVEPLRCDDHLLLAAANEQPALRILLTDVARVQPSVRVRR